METLSLLPGIVCLGRLEEMLELVSSQVQRKENKWVVQKYIGKECTETGRSGEEVVK